LLLLKRPVSFQTRAKILAINSQSQLICAVQDRPQLLADRCEVRLLKFVMVCRRRAGWSRERFRRHLREVHAPLAIVIPQLRRYVQNFAEPDGDGAWDAMIEFWFDDRAAFEAAWQSAQGRRAIADNPGCMDMAGTSAAIVEEDVLRDLR
jgi:uncharacterized protein (TIGR02118 family)